jgi:hypothetical protein
MIVSRDILRKELTQLIRQIDAQMEEVNRHAAEIGIEGYKLRDAQGNWVTAPLLLAKAQAYAALVQLQAK